MLFSLTFLYLSLNLTVPKNVLLIRKKNHLSELHAAMEAFCTASINKSVFQAPQVLYIPLVLLSYQSVLSVSWTLQAIPSGRKGKSSINQPSFPCQNIMPNVY